MWSWVQKVLRLVLRLSTPQDHYDSFAPWVASTCHVHAQSTSTSSISSISSTSTASTTSTTTGGSWCYQGTC
eukprot:4452583-Amphidinium_carterae.4